MLHGQHDVPGNRLRLAVPDAALEGTDRGHQVIPPHGKRGGCEVHGGQSLEQRGVDDAQRGDLGVDLCNRATGAAGGSSDDGQQLLGKAHGALVEEHERALAAGRHACLPKAQVGEDVHARAVEAVRGNLGQLQRAQPLRGGLQVIDVLYW